MRRESMTFFLAFQKQPMGGTYRITPKFPMLLGIRQYHLRRKSHVKDVTLEQSVVMNRNLMKSIIIAIIACLSLGLLCSKADEGNYKGAGADDNYKTVLLFDDLSGRLIDTVIPDMHQVPFQLRDQGVPSHITGFERHIHIKRIPVPMVPGQVRKIPYRMLGIEPGRPKFIADYSLSMRQNEFTGGSCFIWDIDEWKDIPEELKKQKELFIYSRISNQVNWRINTINSPSDSILLDKVLYNLLFTQMTKYHPELFYAPKSGNEGNKNYRKTKLDLARHDDGRLKTSGDGYVFEILLDRSTGCLAVYIRYQNKDEPKDMDVSDIRAMIDPDRLNAVVCNYWVNPDTNSCRKITSTKSDDDAKSAPTGSNETAEDTSFTIRVNQVFGTVRPIWELEIWEELGRRIKESRQAYILYFNDEDIQDLKKPEISQNYLVVTESLYAAMETLRQAAEKEKKLNDERESLKGMMSE